MDKQSVPNEDTNSGHTCITCRVVFARGDLQRDHYKSDWHRYNLKRKVAELPPVTASVFQSKVLAQRQLEEEPKSEVFRCDVCYKSFQSKETFDSHIRSKKHIENAAKRKDTDVIQEKVPVPPAKEEIPTVEDEDEDEWETLEVEEGDDEIPPTNCLFCSHSSAGGENAIEENLSHMSIQHGFFIPDVEYCTDLEGLLTYLGAKVGMGFVCLWCNERGRSFRTLDAVQKHMRDKGHCKMQHEGEKMLEYADFYDYSPSYPDAEKHPDEKESELEEVGTNVLEEQGWQLVLPSGATIGHRSLMRYYRQRLKPGTQLQVTTKGPGTAAIANRYRALGWTGTTGEAAARKAKDLAVMSRLRAKHSLKVGMAGNKLQHHFRPQVNF